MEFKEWLGYVMATYPYVTFSKISEKRLEVYDDQGYIIDAFNGSVPEEYSHIGVVR